MTVELATIHDIKKIKLYDSHIPPNRLGECIDNNLVYVLHDEERGNAIVGILRYSLFWQSIPFLDLLCIDEKYRGKGYGTLMMGHWEEAMRRMRYQYGMLSTQEDETAKFFYEKLGYKKIGAFLPPEQSADELIYLKTL
mgnify:FL=1